MMLNRLRRSPNYGRAMTSLCGGALALNLLLVVGLVGLLAYHGLSYFWPKDLTRFRMKDGTALLAEVYDREEIPDLSGQGKAPLGTRIRVKEGNRDLVGLEFRFLDEADIVERSLDRNAVVLERLEYGNFHGYPEQLLSGDEVLAEGFEAVWELFPRVHAQKREQREAIEDLEKGPLGDLHRTLERLRIRRRGLEDAAEQARIDAEIGRLQGEHEVLTEQLFALRRELDTEQIVMRTADGRVRAVPVGWVVRATRPNALDFGGKLRLYVRRVAEFLGDNPRESNTEGGIFPAIFGTVMMVFLMSIAAVPLGVLAALYLREYARQGIVVQFVRIAVNNLAGVPSIVFGVFGLGFFVYLMGGQIDALFFADVLPSPTFGTGGILWASLTLALLTVPVVIVATEEGLAAVPRAMREGSLALGATRFETIWRVVLPASAPGILTGTILAIARAAGEVAPLMIVGMVKLAPALPIDAHAPFVHLERKFMHLGFHIYDLAFQSPNVEASRPLVFATAFLLVVLVILMNFTATATRNHLRRKYATSAV